MLTKKQFLTIMNIILKEEESQNKFDEALKEYAPSDFTGFAKMGLLDDLVGFLKNVMNDEGDYISWWLWDSPDKGKNPKFCKIWLGDADDPETPVMEITTPEKLYDFLLLNYEKAPSKESIEMAVKAQDNGVKFALKILNEMQETNKKTGNQGWEERNALLKYAQDKIEHEYRFSRGIGADLNLDKELHIIGVLDEEN